MKSQWMGSTAEQRGQEKELMNWKSEQQRLHRMNIREKEQTEKKPEQSLGELWDHNRQSDITVIDVSKGEEQKTGAEKILGKNNSQKFPKFGKRQKSAYSRIWLKPKQDKPKDIHTTNLY